MESTTETLRVAAAIVSTFQTAADVLEAIKDRKESKKRKKEKEVEELMELKILHKSLVEGSRRCRKHCENRHRQYGPAFEAGDDFAIAALKDVVISLQTEIIQPLHVARAVESSVLSFTNLHESSVTCCRDATRAMDQLCQRIMASMQFEPQRNIDASQAPSDASIQSGYASTAPPEPTVGYDLPPSPPPSVGVPQQPFYQREALKSSQLPQRASTLRLPPKPPPKPRYFTPQLPTHDWRSTRTFSQALSEDQAYQTSEEWEIEQCSRVPIQRVGPESDRTSVGTQPTVSSSQSPVYQGASFQNPIYQGISPLSPETNHWPEAPHQSNAWGRNPEQVSRKWDDRKDEDATFPPLLQQSYPAYPQDWKSHRVEGKSENAVGSRDLAAWVDQVDQTGPGGRGHSDLVIRTSSAAQTSASSFRSGRTPRVETLQEQRQASKAPEVFTPRPDLSSEKFIAVRSKTDYQALLKTLPSGIDNIWLPLTRPGMHNRYHGFCSGAWQTRKAPHEGLEVLITPSLKEPVLQWACSTCKFRTKAPNPDTLPDQIFVNQKYDVQYRWLFLAKSHVETKSIFDTAENYKYGCIFCAAQGQATAVHDRLDHLLVHIIAKHKSTTLTAEIKRKTRCVVGGVSRPNASWDIIVPESNQKASPSVATEQFFISASKFFSRRKGKGV